MARTHTAGEGGNKGRGAGLRLVLGVCLSTASAWTTTASKAAAQFLRAVIVYAVGRGHGRVRHWQGTGRSFNPQPCYILEGQQVKKGRLNASLC